jgi:hypothetical protein
LGAAAGSSFFSGTAVAVVFERPAELVPPRRLRLGRFAGSDFWASGVSGDARLVPGFSAAGSSGDARLAPGFSAAGSSGDARLAPGFSAAGSLGEVSLAPVFLRKKRRVIRLLRSRAG